MAFPQKNKMMNKSSEPTPTHCATMQPPNLTGRSLGEVPAIKTLKDAMEEAEILDSQSRQEEISKIERDSIRDTTVIDPINDISLTDESVNFMQTRRGDGKFNSTMKNYSPGNKQGNYSNYNNSDNFSRNWSPQWNKFNRRRLQRYKHQPR